MPSGGVLSSRGALSSRGRLAKSPKKLITSILFNNLPNCYCILPNRQLPPQSQQELPKSAGNSQSQLETPTVGWELPKSAAELPKSVRKTPKVRLKISPKSAWETPKVHSGTPKVD